MILYNDFGFVIVYCIFILLFISIEKLYLGFIKRINLGKIEYII